MSYNITEHCTGCGACSRSCPVKAITGEKKVRYVITETICIDCGTCGRICPHQAVLDANTLPCTPIKRAAWPKPVVSLKACMACHMCVDACPVGCLVMSETARSGGVDAYPYLKDEKACIACEFCRLDCPVDAITMQKPQSLKQ